MSQKKYEIDISPCKNLYVHIIKNLGLQDLIDIKKQHPNVSLYELYETVELINECYKEKGETSFIVYNSSSASQTTAEYISNNLFLSINQDETIATIKINPNLTNAEKLLKEINKTGVIYGIMPEILEHLKNNKVFDFIIFAKGVFSIPVEEAKYKFYYETKRPIPINIQQGTKGVYLDTTLANRTITGKTIAKINKSSEGIIGKTVTGLSIPTKVKPNKPLTLGKNVYEDNSEIKPSIDGIIHYSNEVIEVIPTLILKEPVINQKINFNGTIIIENMVQGSTIKATRDLTIYGTSNSSILEAEGYIYLLTGFVGKGSKATAKQGIFCGYAHNSSLTTINGDIHIGYESLHAYLNSGKSITVEKKVSGGKLTAKENIIMETSGSERITTKTELEINYDPNKKFVSKSFVLETIRNTERKYQKAMKELSRIEISSEKSKTLLIKDSAYQQLTAIVFDLQEQLKELLLTLADLSDDDESLFQFKPGTIVIKEKAWNGTSITINNENSIVDKNANQGSIFRLGNYGIIRERYEEQTID